MPQGDRPEFQPLPCLILTKITLPNPAQKLQPACHQGTPHEQQ